MGGFMTMINRSARQADLIDSSIFNTPIFQVGIGGIGSFTAITLAKMGFIDLTLVDNDNVSIENIPNQFYSKNEIDLRKVDAIQARLLEWEGIIPKALYERYSHFIKYPDESVVISAVDNMATRREMFNATKRRESNCLLFVDGRMGGQQIEVYTVNLCDAKAIEDYEKSLWDDSETPDIPCTSKAIMYNCLMIASLISNNIRLALSRKEYKPLIIMDMENTMLHTPETR